MFHVKLKIKRTFSSFCLFSPQFPLQRFSCDQKDHTKSKGHFRLPLQIFGDHSNHGYSKNMPLPTLSGISHFMCTFFFLSCWLKYLFNFIFSLDNMYGNLNFKCICSKIGKNRMCQLVELQIFWQITLIFFKYKS